MVDLEKLNDWLTSCQAGKLYRPHYTHTGREINAVVNIFELLFSGFESVSSYESIPLPHYLFSIDRNLEKEAVKFFLKMLNLTQQNITDIHWNVPTEMGHIFQIGLAVLIGGAKVSLITCVDAKGYHLHGKKLAEWDKNNANNFTAFFLPKEVKALEEPKIEISSSVLQVEKPGFLVRNISKLYK